MENSLKGKALRRLCKIEAKRKIKGNLGVFLGVIIAISLLTIVTDFLCNFIPIVGGVVSGFISSIFSLSIFSISLKILDEHSIKFSNIFDCFKVKWGKYAIIFLLLSVILTILFIAFFIALTVCLLFLTKGLSNGNVILNLIGLIILCLVFFICLLVLVFWLDASLFSTSYLVVEGYDKGILDLIKLSKSLIKGKIIDYILFNLSFLGWVITIPFTLGLSLIWVIPYISVSTARYYRYLVESSDLFLNDSSDYNC